ncbi:MAG: hypothetical protein KDC98_23035, partial [Planctomycetes bacterium]|nr:hypothetical protein [Planctomycetota bacterium]
MKNAHDRAELASHWTDTLASVQQDLVKVNAVTEAEFTATGSQLLGFSRRSKELVAVSAAIVDLVSGAEMRSRVENLLGLLTTLDEQTARFESDIDTCHQGLAQVESSAGLVEGRTRRLTKSAAGMRTLSLLSQAACAGLGESGEQFRGAAANIRELAVASVKEQHGVGVVLRQLREEIRSSDGCVGEIRGRIRGTIRDNVTLLQDLV